MPPKGSRGRRGGAGASSKDEAAAASAASSSSSGGAGVGGMVGAATIHVPPTVHHTTATIATATMEAVAVNDEDGQSKGGDEASLVMSFLRKYGLVDAANELQTLLATTTNNCQDDELAALGGGAGEDARKRKRSSNNNENDNTNDNDTLPPIDYDLSEVVVDTTTTPDPTATEKLAVPSSIGQPRQQQQLRQQSNTNINILSQATGGGYGYDLDAAPTIALWGVGCAPPLLRISRRSTSTTIGGGGVGSMVNSELLYQGRELDKLLQQSSTADQNDNVADNNEKTAISSFRDEARRYIMGYTCLITWILSLSDDPPGGAFNPNKTKTGGNESLGGKDADDDEREKVIGVNEGKGSLLSSIVASAISSYSSSSSSSSSHSAVLLLSPSCKSELLSLSFPLLVHTYCELLTCGLEHTALALLNTYRQLYEVSHISQLADLDNCTTTSRIVELNDDVVLQGVLHNEMRLLKTQIVLLAKKMEEVESVQLGLYNKGNKMRF